jgi:hypothetical protein
MAWEISSCGKWYYSRTIRVGGSKRLRQYLGSGAVADSAANTDALRRAERDALGALQRSERTQLQDADRLLIHFFREMSVLAIGALVASGCYRQYGWWRN